MYSIIKKEVQTYNIFFVLRIFPLHCFVYMLLLTCPFALAHLSAPIFVNSPPADCLEVLMCSVLFLLVSRVPPYDKCCVA